MFTASVALYIIRIFHNVFIKLSMGLFPIYFSDRKVRFPRAMLVVDLGIPCSTNAGSLCCYAYVIRGVTNRNQSYCLREFSSSGGGKAEMKSQYL